MSFLSSDRAWQAGDPDVLGYRPFAHALAKTINAWDGLDCLVIGLFGPWGCGKTSIKNMLLDELVNSEQKPEILEFNPWHWSGQSGLYQQFFLEVGLALGKEESPDSIELAKQWFSLGSILSMSGAAGMAVGTALLATGIPVGVVLTTAGKAAKSAGDIAKQGADALEAQAKAQEKPLENIKRELAGLLADEDKNLLTQKLLIVLDDIDRCTADEIRGLFRLVKANSDLPKFVFLLCFDRQVVESALTRDGIQGPDYLEKIVQAGFDVPRIQQAKLMVQLEAGLREILASVGVGDQFDGLRWRRILIHAGSAYFDNLRRVKRYIGSLFFHVGLFGTGNDYEVNSVDLAAMEILRVFEPDLYRELPRLKEELLNQMENFNGTPRAPEESHDALQTFWAGAKSNKKGAATAIIEELFPCIGSDGDRRLLLASEKSRLWFAERRICHPDHFDKYFLLTLPEGAISRAELERILNPQSGLEDLRRQWRAFLDSKRHEEAIEQIALMRDRLSGIEPAMFIQALCDIGDYFSRNSKHATTLPYAQTAASVIEAVLEVQESPSIRGRTLFQAFSQTSGLHLPAILAASYVKDRFRGNPGGEPFMDEGSVSELHLLLQGKIETAAQNGDLLKNPALRWILELWANYSPSDTIQEWVRKYIETPEGLFRILRAFLTVERVTDSSGRLVQSERTTFSGDTLLKYVPLDELRIRASEALAHCEGQDRLLLEAFLQCTSAAKDK